MTTFVLLNQSTITLPEYGGTLTDPILEQIAAACEEQLNLHVAPEWGGSYVVRVDSQFQAGEAPVHILDDLPDAPGAAAYHAAAAGAPVVFAARTAFDAFIGGGKEMLSEGLSHEFCETAGDVSAAFWADNGDGTEQATELCDRAQGSNYQLQGVTVANFLFKNAFFPGATGQFDWLRVLAGQNDQTPGGYRILRDAGGNEHNAMKLGFARHGNRGVWAEGNLSDGHLKRKSHFSSRSYRRGLRLSVAA